MMSAAIACVMNLVMLSAGSGPRLTDADLFAAMDLHGTELAAVRTAVEANDYPAARKAFAEHFRSRGKPVWFTMVRQKPDKPERRPSTTTADRLLAHQWKWGKDWFDLGRDIDWSQNQMTEGESATVEWNASLNRHFHFRTLVDAWRATGEEKYAAEVVGQMIDWIEDCPMLDRSGNSPYHYAWETLNTACRLGDTWPNALFAILPCDRLDDDALVTIVKSMVEQARHLDRWPTRSGNWLTAESKALYIAGVLLPELRDAATWREHAVERLYRQLHTDVYPDGLEIELALGYNNWVLRNFAEVLDLARLNGQLGELPDDYLQRMEAMYDYQAYVVMPGFIAPGLNDSGNSSPASLLEAGFGYFPKREDFLWVGTRGQKGKQPERTSVAFPYSGHYVMRSGWDDDARWLLLDAGPFGSGHQHEDKLTMIVCAYGQPLVLDAGSYMYDRSRWRRYVLSTRGHNTIRVDGEDQNRRRDRASWVLPQPFEPAANTWVSDKKFDYVVGRYESGYGPKREIKVLHTRAVVFVKPDYWVVVDTLRPEDDAEHTCESLFHLGADQATLAGPAGPVTTANPQTANLIVWPVAAEKLDVEVVRGREEEPVQGWAGKPWRPVPTAVIRTKARGTFRLATLLYPLAAGQKSPLAGVRWLPVTTATGPTDDAAALEIRFSDGRTDQLLVAGQGGVARRAGSLETEAELYWTGAEGRSFSVGGVERK